jgi:hypothetical protein
VFKSRLGDGLSSLRFFVVFLSPSRQILGWYLSLGHSCFLSYPFEFIIHLLPFHLLLYSRGGQLDQLWKPHFRRQQSLRDMSLSSSEAIKPFSLQVSLSVAMLSKDVNTKMKIEDLRQSRKKSLYLCREMKQNILSLKTECY